MDCAAQTTDCLVHSQVQFKDKLQVSGVVLATVASWFMQAVHVHRLKNKINFLKI